MGLNGYIVVYPGNKPNSLRVSYPTSFTTDVNGNPASMGTGGLPHGPAVPPDLPGDPRHDGTHQPDSVVGSMLERQPCRDPAFQRLQPLEHPERPVVRRRQFVGRSTRRVQRHHHGEQCPSGRRERLLHRRLGPFHQGEYQPTTSGGPSAAATWARSSAPIPIERTRPWRRRPARHDLMPRRGGRPATPRSPLVRPLDRPRPLSHPAWRRFEDEPIACALHSRRSWAASSRVAARTSRMPRPSPRTSGRISPRRPHDMMKDANSGMDLKAAKDANKAKPALPNRQDSWLAGWTAHRSRALIGGRSSLARGIDPGPRPVGQTRIPDGVSPPPERPRLRGLPSRASNDRFC